ncbi:peptidoglycan peptidase [Desulfonema ishimotonii]|uniref:Peptidoglycan peptidase n=1 Tax=Desulfonema ishimotonii TaxID=45657 RepID=A0A401G066_9BACT|nr:YiiX/YebB-like N1pC/P60 family cysteine hydrolase [Desulfonema ishimotonii]GBC62611.1 peptidoglycan peptidase [Desulfonema ishimotonii]
MPYIATSVYDPKEGDIVFQSLQGYSDLIRAIEGVTHSHYSHCGVIIKEKESWFVIEALGYVKLTPLNEWTRQGRCGQFYVYRLKKQYNHIIPKFKEKLKNYLGTPYDIKYEMDSRAIYCSELIYKGFYDATGEKLGELVKLGDLDWKPYKQTIEKYENGPVPLERIMIKPRHLSEASQIEKIFEFDF